MTQENRWTRFDYTCCSCGETRNRITWGGYPVWHPTDPEDHWGQDESSEFVGLLCPSCFYGWRRDAETAHAQDLLDRGSVPGPKTDNHDFVCCSCGKTANWKTGGGRTVWFPSRTLEYDGPKQDFQIVGYECPACEVAWYLRAKTDHARELMEKQNASPW